MILALEAQREPQHNSVVRFLIESDFTLFMISWKNPTSVDRKLSPED